MAGVIAKFQSLQSGAIETKQVDGRGHRKEGASALPVVSLVLNTGGPARRAIQIAAIAPEAKLAAAEAGIHRLEAYKLLGLETIMSRLVACSDADARMLEIAENLHRVDLSVLERADQVAEWVRLTEAKGQIGRGGLLGQLDPKVMGRPEGGIRAAVRDLGIDRMEARRSIKLASIAPEAKLAADACQSSIGAGCAD